MLPLFNAVCVVASVMCCIQECVTSINCGMCLGSFSPWSVTDHYLIQWLEFAVDGKHRAASQLTPLKLKFCRYREIKWVCANAADLCRESLCTESTGTTRSNGSHTWASDTAEAWKLQDDWTFPWVPPWFYFSAWQTSSDLHTAEAFCWVPSDKVAQVQHSTWHTENLNPDPPDILHLLLSHQNLDWKF